MWVERKKKDEALAHGASRTKYSCDPNQQGLMESQLTYHTFSWENFPFAT